MHLYTFFPEEYSPVREAQEKQKASRECKSYWAKESKVSRIVKVAEIWGGEILEKTEPQRR